MSGNERLSRSIIIKERKLFLEAYDTGQAVKGRFLNIFFTKNNNPDFRFGITVTKKTGKAVVRNRSRRLIKEIIRKQLKRLKSGISVIFIVKREFIGRSYEEIKRDLDKIIYRAGLYQDKPSE